eukprot:m.97086 g.97086  ORF g.97086 m.97086 type:complete len:259 (-) comp8813_c0_seq4:162-938(-)
MTRALPCPLTQVGVGGLSCCGNAALTPARPLLLPHASAKLRKLSDRKLIKRFIKNRKGLTRIVAQNLDTNIQSGKFLVDGFQYLVCGPGPIEEALVPRAFCVVPYEAALSVSIERIRLEHPTYTEREVEELLCLFQAHDIRGHGAIDLAILDHLLQAAGHPASMSELMRAIADAHIENSNQVDFYEFLGIRELVVNPRSKGSRAVVTLPESCPHDDDDHDDHDNKTGDDDSDDEEHRPRGKKSVPSQKGAQSRVCTIQ